MSSPSILDTAEYRKLALIAAGVDPSNIPAILDTATWRHLMLAALYAISSGGGGGGYISGVVDTYNDLPVTVGTPALNTVYLVRFASGIWLINRKPGGLYIRIANNGTLDDWEYLSAFPEVQSDLRWRVYNETDPTKEVALDVSNVSTGTLRTLGVPNASGRIQIEGQPIGNVTPAAGTFTNLSAAPTSGSALTLTGGTVTASAPLISATQTWNNAAVTFTGLRVNVTNTASAAASLLADVQVGGSNVLSINRAGALGAAGNAWLAFNSAFGSAASMGGVWSIGGAAFNVQSSLGGNSGVIQLGNNMSIGWSSNAAPTAANADLRLFRDAADTLAQRRDANPQTFRLYNTTDAGLTNFERGFMRWSSNVLQIGSEKAGTGSARALEFQTDGTTRFSISDAGNVRVFGAALRLGPNLNAGSLIFQHGDGVEAFRCQYNATFRILGRLLEMGADGTGGTIQIHTDGDNLMALRRGTTAQNLRIYNTVSGTNNVNFERANFRWASNEFIIDAELGGTGTALRGIKLGSATSSLLGFYGVTPVDQPATVADPAGGGTVDTEARTAINAIIDRLQELGLIA